MSRRGKSIHKNFKKNQAKSIYKQFDELEKREKELEKKSWLETVSSKMKLPADVLAGAPILTTTGKYQITLENYKGIIEYTGSIIRIQTKTCRICIEGKNLNIDYFANEDMRISGIIHAIRYI